MARDLNVNTMTQPVTFRGLRVERYEVVAGGLANDTIEGAVIGGREAQRQAARHAGETLEPGHLFVGAAEAAGGGIGERVGRRVDDEVLRPDHVEVGAGFDGSAANVVIVHGLNLALARRACERRVATRRQQPGRHEHDRLRYIQTDEALEQTGKGDERVPSPAAFLPVGRTGRSLTRYPGQQFSYVGVIPGQVHLQATPRHRHQRHAVARRKAGDELRRRGRCRSRYACTKRFVFYDQDDRPARVADIIAAERGGERRQPGFRLSAERRADPNVLEGLDLARPPVNR